MQIFLSYASEDRELAEEIQLALAGLGHHVFYDKASLPAGGDYHSRIQSAVRSADIFVFLISPSSVAKGSYALTELKYARAKWAYPKEKIVPVLLRATAWDAIPAYLKSVTVLEPEGNVAAEVLTAVESLGKRHVHEAAMSSPSQDRIQDQESREGKLAVGRRIQIWVAIIGLAGVLGASIISNWPNIFGEKQDPPGTPTANSSQGGKNNLNISGSNVKGIPWPATQTDKLPKLDDKDAPALSGGDFSARNGAQGGMGNLNIKDSRVEIHQGDPPEVRERKMEAAKQAVADSILSNLSAIDARLSYVQTALKDDPFEMELKAINDKLAPSAAQQLTGGYRQLVNQERISSLRLTMNSRPLKQGLDGILLSTLREAHIDGSRLRAFFDEQMPEIDRTTEMLYRVLTEPGFMAANPSPGERAYAIHRLALQRESLEIQAAYALLYGLDALRALGQQPDEINARLESLQILTPRNLITEKEIFDRLIQTMNRQQHLVIEKKKLESEALGLLKEGTASLRAVDNLLEIRPTDTWQEIVGKARSLRDFGRITEAVQAFDKYGQIFKDTDPTAVRYAATAKAFTQSIGRLSVKGGCYVFEVRAGGPEAAAGLQVGDILIELAGKPIPGMAELTKLYSEIKDDKVLLQLLRLNRGTGQFEWVNTTLRIGAILRGVMPI